MTGQTRVRATECPRCGNEDLEREDNPADGVQCLECGYAWVEPLAGAPQELVDGAWRAALAVGYKASAMKGSPSTTHAKKAGAWIALCGKRPGQAKPGSSHRDRIGWYVGGDKEPTCPKCRAALIGHAGPSK